MQEIEARIAQHHRRNDQGIRAAVNVAQAAQTLDRAPDEEESQPIMPGDGDASADGRFDAPAAW
jgi:hypothetical protein